MTPLALLLAWLFVNEAGFDGQRDHAAIYHALKNRSESMGWTFRETLELYSDGRLHRPNTPRARWVTSLREDGGEPERVPDSRGPAWTDETSDKWKATLERARRWLRRPPRNPCTPGTQEHWAGRVQIDRVRARAALANNRWSMVYCGRIHQVGFYAVNRNVRQWVTR